MGPIGGTDSVFPDTRNLTSGILGKCEMPPGENNSVPLQLQWGEYYSPVYEISYRPPTILRFKLEIQLILHRPVFSNFTVGRRKRSMST